MELLPLGQFVQIKSNSYYHSRQSRFRNKYVGIVSLCTTTTSWLQDGMTTKICRHSPWSMEVRLHRFVSKFEGQAKEIDCPLIIPDYNNYMGGVDLADQAMCYYSVGRKTMKWWRRCFGQCMIRLSRMCLWFTRQIEHTRSTSLTKAFPNENSIFHDFSNAFFLTDWPSTGSGTLTLVRQALPV